MSDSFPRSRGKRTIVHPDLFETHDTPFVPIDDQYTTFFCPRCGRECHCDPSAVLMFGAPMCCGGLMSVDDGGNDEA